MSESIPTIREGDSVRIMQTQAMESAGLANLRGIVLVVMNTPHRGQVAAVAVNGHDTLHVPVSSLMLREIAASEPPHA